jgi:SAM-dependent methyltransferase
MSLYQQLFTHFYDPFMQSIEASALRERRAKLLEHLAGKVLDVGSGTGVNFSFYTENASVVALEPSPFMVQKLKARLAKGDIRCDVQVRQSTLEDLLNTDMEGSFDSVVCTLVLCTVPNPQKAIQSIYKLLKPGGKLVLLEHILSGSQIGSGIQNIINPVWTIFADGCNLNRRTDQLIKETDLRLIRESYFFYSLPFYEAEYEKNTYENS